MGSDDDAASTRTPKRAGTPGAPLRQLLAFGRAGWAVVGVAGAVLVVGFIAGQLRLVLIPLVLALFPATLLAPLTVRLKRQLPDALAASVALVVGVAVIGTTVALMVPLVAAELPRLTQTAGEAIGDFARFVDRQEAGTDLGGVAVLIERFSEQVSDLGELVRRAVDAAVTAVEIAVGAVLTLVVLFFYLKDAERISRSVVAFAPPRRQPQLRRVGTHAWHTLGAYFRGQLVIALIDAVAIGVGLALLRIPLALPLAVVVFFGGLFPIVGAVVAGGLAVLVALAHGGVLLAAGVLALIVAVQQLEGNVLEPLILSHLVRLHPLIVILAVTAGAVTFGVLGAFLAVPAAAVLGQVRGVWRGDVLRPRGV